MNFSLSSVFDDLPRLKLIDVGASPIDGDPFHQPLIESDAADLVCFEPDEQQFEALEKKQLPNTTCFKKAIGRGGKETLHTCVAPGMTSLLEPDLDVLAHFHGFDEWGTVTGTEECETWRLDDLPEVEGADFIKIDVQGGEVPVLEGGARTLAGACMIQTEVQFVPFYKDQPLFAEIDQVLRGAGYFLHRFLPLHSRVFKPMLINNDIYAGLSQHLWSDAVYVRRFTDFPKLPAESLLKIATLANDIYGSVDLTVLALHTLDQREGTDREPRYIQSLQQLMAQQPPPDMPPQ